MNIKLDVTINELKLKFKIVESDMSKDEVNKSISSSNLLFY